MLEPNYPIIADRIIVRPFAPDDLDDFYAYYSLPDVARYVPWQPAGRADAAEGLQRRAGQYAIRDEGDALVLAVARKDTGTVIGEVMLRWGSREHQQGEIGFAFHTAHHGLGLAFEAAQVALRLGFVDLGLHRISGGCDARNAPSARLMTRLGMRQEAHLRQNEFFKGEWSDELVYAILADEWRGRT